MGEDAPESDPHEIDGMAVFSAAAAAANSMTAAAKPPDNVSTLITLPPEFFAPGEEFVACRLPAIVFLFA
jgi:hypothetical protein